MAVTLQSVTSMTLGQEILNINVPDTEEKVGLRMTVTQTSTGESNARLTCLDDEGRVVKSLVISGSGTEEVEIDQISGALTCAITCNEGACDVSLFRLEGTEKLGTSATDALVDASVTTAKLADASVVTAKLAPGAASAPKIDLSGLKVLSGVGNNGASTTATMTGTVAGERVIAVFSTPTAGTGPLVAHPVGTDFAAVIPANDDIDQLSASDLSLDTLIVMLLPAAS